MRQANTFLTYRPRPGCPTGAPPFCAWLAANETGLTGTCELGVEEPKKPSVIFLSLSLSFGFELLNLLVLTVNEALFT